MQKTDQSHKLHTIVNSDTKDDRSTLGSTKGHSKPSTGGKQAGPPPAPQPPKK